MGQTLTHGIYLPDEGERNCYDGLASNWSILDGAVGTVAEHTTQIAGKAPLVHTHTKSDITDLLNSNFIPSANNSYDLGSSSYQWNNLYAKNYYYNGVAWGLDKANTWTGSNTFTADSYNNSVIMNNRTLDLSQGNPALSATNQCMILFMDSTKTRGYARFQSWTAAGETIAVIGATYRPDANTETDFSVWLSNRNNDTTFHPYGVPNPNLGNSTFKWKTLNGVNPGALSLPNFDSDGYTDLSSNLTENVQYTYTPAVDGWIALFAQVDGFHAENAVGIFNADQSLGNDSFRWAASATAAINLSRQTGKYYGSVILPVIAGYRYYCWLTVDQSTTLGLKKLIFYKAKGNV